MENKNQKLVLENLVLKLTENRKEWFIDRAIFLAQYYPDLFPLVVEYVIIQITSELTSKDIYHQPLDVALEMHEESSYLIQFITKRMVRWALLTPLDGITIKKITEKIPQSIERKRTNH